MSPSDSPSLPLYDVDPAVAARIAPFFEELLARYGGALHSLHITGSALTPDYQEKVSDINSLVVLKEMDFGFLRFLASIGDKYRKKNIAAPLIMTAAYIRGSLDVFPIEFSDLRLIHRTVYGEDILEGLTIDKAHLRLQCEREVKTKLIGLRQGYVATLDKKPLLVEKLSQSITGYIPLFRAIISLMGQEPPVPKHAVLDRLCETVAVETDIFKKMLLLKQRKIILSKGEIETAFEEYYKATERIGAVIDELQAHK